MFRILLIAAFILVGAQQGVSVGKVDMEKSETFVTEVIAVGSQFVADKDCCSGDAVADEKPSFCKSDCKAVIPAASLRPTKVFIDHTPLTFSNIGSVGRGVDLRPPIS